MHGCHSDTSNSKFSTIGLKAVLGGLGNDATEIKSTKNLIAEMEQALIAYWWR